MHVLLGVGGSSEENVFSQKSSLSPHRSSLLSAKHLSFVDRFLYSEFTVAGILKTYVVTYGFYRT